VTAFRGAGALAVALAAVQGAFACTTVVVGRQASGTGRVIVGHTEDFDRFRIDHGHVPPRDWPADAMLPQDRACARIRQVPHTYGFYWASAVSRRGVAPGCDSALNENGVFVTMNYGGKSRVGERESKGCSDGDVRNRAVDGSAQTEGGVRDQVLRCIAERSATAAAGMQVATNLLTRYGMVGGGWTWVVADSREAWIVQGVNGSHFVANRVPDDEVAVIPNVLTVRGLPEGTVCSPGLVEEALRRGWVRADEPFDFSRAYQRPDWFMHAHSVSRFRQAAEILTGRPWTRDVTFAVRPCGPVTVGTVKRILSSHVVEGPSAHVDDVGPICRNDTGEATVCVFGDKPSETTLDLAFGWPCLFPWIRLRPLSEPLPGDLEVPDGARRLDEQCERKPAVPLSLPSDWMRLVAAVEKIAASSPERIAAWKRVKGAIEGGESGSATLAAALRSAEEFVAAGNGNKQGKGRVQQ